MLRYTITEFKFSKKYAIEKKIEKKEKRKKVSNTRKSKLVSNSHTMTNTRAKIFVGDRVMADFPVLKMTICDDLEFYHPVQIADMEMGYPAFTEFTVKMAVENREVVYPTKATADYTLRELKEMFHAEYGPYSQKTLTAKIKGTMDEYHTATLLNNPRKIFIRRLWIFTRLCNLFEDSMPMMKIRMINFVVQVIGKINTFYTDINAQIWKYEGDAFITKYTTKVLEAMDRVYNNIKKWVLENPLLLRYFPETDAVRLMCDIQPHMVSKITQLQREYWIYDSVAILAAPRHYEYWALFWIGFLGKNLKLPAEVCSEIAGYMPQEIIGSSFIEFFRKSYNMKERRWLTDYQNFKTTSRKSREFGSYFLRVGVNFL
jgi:hypothetical protein